MIQNIIDAYQWLKIGNNPLLDTWFLFGTPFPIIAIVASYMIFVLYLGPKWMKNREPFNLRYIIIIYNALQVYYNFWMIKTVRNMLNLIVLIFITSNLLLSQGTTDHQFTNFFFNFGCVTGLPIPERQRIHYEITRAFWHGTMNKIFDLLDTIFFVLTKKQSHITFLHVHHHVVVVLIMWIFGKYFPGIELTIVGLCNTVVHMFMYFYYLIAALGPAYKKYLWWKKYLTLLQIVQFLIITAYTTAALYVACDFNKYLCYLIIFEALFNLTLFVNFYIKAYRKDEKLSRSMRNKMAMCGSMQSDQSYDINQTKYHDLHTGHSSEMDNWLLFGSPGPIITLLVSYTIFVLYLGPRWMQNRKPFNLKYIIIFYNAAQVFYNYWILSSTLVNRSFFTYFLSFGCTKSMSPAELTAFSKLIYSAYWHGTVNKMLDLLDTVFFVLRKKQSHITFLHVQHHTTICGLIWAIGKYYSGFEPAVVGFCNTMVHMVMYFYYLIAALGPQFKKYLWWKKYLTVMQMVQFIIIGSYSMIALCYSCGFSTKMLCIMGFESAFNLSLFLNFYAKSYNKKGKNLNANMTKAIKTRIVCGSQVLDSWPLFGSPIPVTVILVLYAYFVLYFGPNWMKNRKPYNLKYAIIAYNAIQVYYNFWLIISLALWHAVMDRILDLVDTVFFVLTKKQSHVTFLHVYHHISVVAILWTASKYFQGLEFGIVGILNIFVHMIMYFYYLIAALGPQFKKYLWWKRYLTTLQITQFIIILIYMVASFWLACDFKRFVVNTIIAESVINLVLFLNFYMKAYKKGLNQAMKDKISICGSPILDSWPLYGSPIPIFTILISYISFVLYFGPKWMRNREPFNLKYVIIAYNAIQVYHNYWMITTAMSQDNYFKYLLGFGCANVTKTEDEIFRFKMYRAFWIVTLNKLLDLLDTVFFVLRKKQSHVTFLHVHHHAAMVAIIWTFGKYYPGLELMIVGLCNLIVHTVMYGYYLIAALGPKYRKYLWWKKQLTLMQIAQFLIIITYMTISLWTSCGYKPIITI
uniref:Elongation of very long chain fatty acids protein n=1 Tax=Culicoides sonorensis TaxID=179676 RepID=A0A336M5W3_CULSO